MAQGTIKYKKYMNDGRSIPSGADLDDYYNIDSSGFYYIGTGVTNCPYDYSGLIVVGRNGAGYQLLIPPTGVMLARARTGNPAVWSTWKKVIPDVDSTTLTASFSVGNLHASSGIHAYKNGNIVIVTGYIRSTVELSANTQIASVGVTTIYEMFDSPISESGDGTRLKLQRDGKLILEHRMLANAWYSFSFTAFTK